MNKCHDLSRCEWHEGHGIVPNAAWPARLSVNEDTNSVHDSGARLCQCTDH